MNLFILLISLVSLFIYHYISSILLNLIPRRYRRKKDIQGQRVLITGAGNGVGRQLAIEFARHSTYLILLDIDRASLVETVNSLPSETTVFYYECDVSNYKKVYEVADKIRKDIGDVDILVNNAGIVDGKFLMDLSEEKIIKVMEVNALAHVWMCKAFLPSMMKKDQGHIVSVASIASKLQYSGLTDYCASKNAAHGFAESLELELREQNLYGIKISIVCPTPINTSMWKWGAVSFAGMLEPKFVAEEIVAGVLEEKEIIFIPSYLRLAMILKESSPRWLVNWYMQHSGNLKIKKSIVEKNETPNRGIKKKQ